MINKKEYQKEYYHKNKERCKKNIKKYQQSKKGKEKIKEYNQREEVKAKRRQREKNNYGKQKRISQTINRQIKLCISLYSKRGFLQLQEITDKKYKILYGIDLQEIVDYLKPFPKNVDKYEIDHIVPLSRFDLTKREDIKQAYSKSNLQLLTSIENKKKGSKLISSSSIQE